jgi:hypothetical protein
MNLKRFLSNEINIGGMKPEILVTVNRLRLVTRLQIYFPGPGMQNIQYPSTNLPRFPYDGQNQKVVSILKQLQLAMRTIPLCVCRKPTVIKLVFALQLYFLKHEHCLDKYTTK